MKNQESGFDFLCCGLMMAICVVHILVVCRPGCNLPLKGPSSFMGSRASLLFRASSCLPGGRGKTDISKVSPPSQCFPQGPFCGRVSRSLNDEQLTDTIWAPCGEAHGGSGIVINFHSQTLHIVVSGWSKGRSQHLSHKERLAQSGWPLARQFELQ